MPNIRIKRSTTEFNDRIDKLKPGELAIKNNSLYYGPASLDDNADQTPVKVKTTDDGVSAVNGKTGVVTLNKSDVGLNNVDNIADKNKSVGRATHADISDAAGILRGNNPSHYIYLNDNGDLIPSGNPYIGTESNPFSQAHINEIYGTPVLLSWSGYLPLNSGKLPTHGVYLIQSSYGDRYYYYIVYWKDSISGGTMARSANADLAMMVRADGTVYRRDNGSDVYGGGGFYYAKLFSL